MKAHEMTEADYRAMMQRSLKWNGGSWFIGKPVTKKTFAAMHPNASQTQSTNEAPEYEDDQQVLSEANERFLHELWLQAQAEMEAERKKELLGQEDSHDRGEGNR